MGTNFRDDAGIVRLDGTLYAPGASVGDVLTVQADGSLAPAAGGGSQPGTPIFRAIPFAFDTPGLVPLQLPITAVDQGAKSFTISGDHAAEFPVGMYFFVGGSTGNDGYYTPASATFAAGHTAVVTNESIPDATVDGVLRNSSTAGLALYTPQIGEWLLAAGLSVITAWDGTTPKGDIGSLYNAENAMFQINGGPIDMTAADTTAHSQDSHAQSAQASVVPPSDAFQNQLSTLTFPGGEQRQIPSKFVTADQFKVVVSTDGSVGGGDPGSAQGAGELYLLTVVPATS